MPVLPAFIPANAIEAAITIAVLVIAFIGWLVQIAGQVKGTPPAPQNRPRPRPQTQRPAAQAQRPARPADERLQSEIDAFLREVSGGRRNGGRRAKRDELEEIDIEVIPEEDLPAESTRRSIASAQPFYPPSQQTIPPIVGQNEVPGQVSEWDREHQRRRERLISTVAERKLEATPLGADLKRHIDQFAAETAQLRREKEQAEKSLAEARAELQALRTSVGASSPPGKSETAASRGARFAALLKQRHTVKDAIVINEILSRPKGMSRSRR